jgi:alkylation response protein AidB-like acyl-CoA dehydrogenase
LDFSLTAEQLALKKRVLAFAANRIASLDDYRLRMKACGEEGLLGLPVPPEYGGSGLSTQSCVVAMEAFGYGCPDQGLAFSVNAQLFTCALPIATYGSEEQRQRWLPGLLDGSLVGGHCVTEPNAGSDFLAMTTRAEPQGDTWVLSGHKSYVTNGPVADVLLVFAATGEGEGLKKELSAFAVDTQLSGVRVGPALRTMGLRSCPISEVQFDHVVLPNDALIGKRGLGGAIFQHEMDRERVCLFAAHLGGMHRLLDKTIEHSKQRMQFGKTLGQFQAVAHRVADDYVNLEAGRLLLLQAAWALDQGQRATLPAAVAKLFVSESYVKSTLHNILNHGGAGYRESEGIEVGLRDSVGSLIYSGTSDIQRNIIARWLGFKA